MSAARSGEGGGAHRKTSDPARDGYTRLVTCIKHQKQCNFFFETEKNRSYERGGRSRSIAQGSGLRSYPLAKTLGNFSKQISRFWDLGKWFQSATCGEMPPRLAADVAFRSEPGQTLQVQSNAAGNGVFKRQTSDRGQPASFVALPKNTFFYAIRVPANA